MQMFHSHAPFIVIPSSFIGSQPAPATSVATPIEHKRTISYMSTNVCAAIALDTNVLVRTLRKNLAVAQHACNSEARPQNIV
jgi:hypothetical protein